MTKAKLLPILPLPNSNRICWSCILPRLHGINLGFAILYTNSLSFFPTEKPSQRPKFIEHELDQITKTLKLKWSDDSPNMSQFLFRYRAIGSGTAWTEKKLPYTTHHYEIHNIEFGTNYEVCH